MALVDLATTVGTGRAGGACSVAENAPRLSAWLWSDVLAVAWPIRHDKFSVSARFAASSNAATWPRVRVEPVDKGFAVPVRAGCEARTSRA